MALHLDYLFVGAHPDDCEIMAGGTLLKLIAEGKKVGIIDLTGGRTWYKWQCSNPET